MLIAYFLQRQVRNNVVVMNHSLVGEKLSQPSSIIFIPHFWLTKCQDQLNIANLLLYIRCCKDANSSSQTMASYVYLLIQVSISQLLHFNNNLRFYFFISVKKPSMNLALIATTVGILSKIGITEPVLNIFGSSDGDNDCFQPWRKAYKSLAVVFAENFHILKLIFVADIAIPCFDVIYTLVGDSRHVGQLKGN